MSGVTRRGAFTTGEQVSLLFIAVAVASFVGVYLVLFEPELTAEVVIGSVLVVIGLAGLTAVYAIGQGTDGSGSSTGSGAVTTDVGEALSEIAVLLDEMNEVPHRDQVAYELDRAMDALDRGDTADAAEAISSIQNLLSTE